MLARYTLRTVLALSLFFFCVSVRGLYQAFSSVPAELDLRAYNYVRINSVLGPGGQRVSGDLSSSGTGKVLTFASCPSGLKVGNSVYISGGTGTAEAAVITATTCGLVLGLNGTVTITTANTHSGTWEVRSSDSGLPEAVAVIEGGPGNGVVRIPTGQWPLYTANTTIRKHVVLAGSGRETTILSNRTTNQNSISFDFSSGAQSGVGTSAGIRDLTIIAGSNTASQVAGATSGAGVKVNGANNDVFLERIQIRNHGIGIDIVDSWNAPRVNDFTLLYLSSYGVRHRSTAVPSSHGGAVLSNGQISNNGASGSISSSGAGISYESGAGFYANQVDIQRFPTGVLIEPAATHRAIHGFWTNILADTSVFNGYLVKGSAGTIYDHVFTSCWSAGAGKLVGSDTFTIGANGVQIEGANTSGIYWNGGRIRGNGGRGVSVEGGTEVHFTGVAIVSNSQLTDNTSPGFYVGPGVSQWSLVNARAGNYDTIFTTAGQNYGVYVAAGASSNYRIIGNDLTLNATGPGFDGGTGTNKVIANNLVPQSFLWATINPSGGVIDISNAPFTPNIIVSSNAAVSSMTPTYEGAHKNLLFTHATPGGISGTGNIAPASTQAQYSKRSLDFINDKWY